LAKEFYIPHLLNEVMLQIWEIIMLCYLWTRERSKQFSEYTQHSWRPRPTCYHCISDL